MLEKPGLLRPQSSTRHKACSTLTPNMEQRTAVSIRFWAVCWRQGKMNKSRGSHTQWGSRILGVGDARRWWSPVSRTKCGVETNGPESGHLAAPLDQQRLQPLRGKIKNRPSPPVKAFRREWRRSMGRVFWSSSSSSVSQARVRPHQVRGITMVSPEVDSRGKLPHPFTTLRRLGWKANA